MRRIETSSLSALVFLSGCMFNQLDSDLDRIHQYGRVEGKVVVETQAEGPVTVALLRIPDFPGAPLHLVESVVQETPGAFVFPATAGRYRVMAFYDSDLDQHIDDDELAGASRVFDMTRRERVGDLEVVLNGTLERFLPEVVDDRLVVAGLVGELDDERFGPEAAHDGVWTPLEMMQTHHPGLYYLQEYDPERIPVLFVHGMAGYPQQFEAMIDALDTERFQPWIFSFPSGLRLAPLGEFLSQSITETRVSTGAPHICLVVHSMGGVVTREALSRQLEAEHPTNVRGLTTVASPLGGMDSAETGVRMAPDVVPAWYDLVPDGGFLRTLYREPLPDSIPYHLLFTFAPEGPDDGVVPIQSQLREEAQREAELIRGFEATHVGALSDEEVLEHVSRALDRCAANVPPATDAADTDEDPVGEEPN